MVGLDVALTSATTAADDASLAQAIFEFSQDGVIRVVLADVGTPADGPPADPTFLHAVVRGSPRVPVDEDGVIRSATFLIPRLTGPPEPAFSLAIVGRLGGMDQAALEKALRSSDGQVSLPTWRSGRGWEMPVKGATRPLHVFELLALHGTDGARGRGD